MSDEPREPGPEDPLGDLGDLGDLGEEAAKLLGVLAGWTRSVDEHVATGAPECQWCPVCRVVHVVRTSSPEVREHLTTAAASLLQAAAGLLGAMAESSPTGARNARDAGSQQAGDGLEHIDLDDPGDGEEQP